MGKKRPHGTGSIRKRGTNRYQLRVFDRQTRRVHTRSVKAESNAEAKKLLREFTSDVFGGKVADGSQRLTVATVAAGWLAGKHIAETTYSTYTYALGVIEREIGHLTIRELRTENIERFAANLRKRLAPDTCRTVMTVLRAVLRYARRRGFITSDPTEAVEIPRFQSRAHSVPHDEFIAAFLDALTENHRLMALIGASTGMRRGELCGLQIGDVDLATRRITIRRVVVQAQGGAKLKPAAKTVAGQRTIRVSAADAALLADRIEALREITREKTQNPTAEPDPRLFVFSPVGDGERFYSPYAVSQVFRRARERAGIDVPIRLHMLRHWAATKAAAAGVPLPELMARFGWRDQRTALRYQHATGGWDDTAAEAVANALAVARAHGSGSSKPPQVVADDSVEGVA